MSEVPEKLRPWALEYREIRELIFGWCPVIALAIHQVFGFPIYRIFDPYEIIDEDEDEVDDECWNRKSEIRTFTREALLETFELSDPESPDFPFVHDFCKDGQVRVDIRGRSIDEEEFLSDFKLDDYPMDVNEFQILDVEKYRANEEAFIDTRMGEGTFKKMYSRVITWLEEHREVYAK